MTTPTISPVARAEAKRQGLKHYFTGVPCRAGHVARRLVSNYMCVICLRIHADKWNADNPQQLKAIKQAWNAANHEYKLQLGRDWHAANRERINGNKAKWAAANVERRRNINQARRARLVKAEGKFSQADIDNIARRQKQRCAYCRKRLGAAFHIDHIKPLARGGSNWPRNLQLLCATCNLRKADKDPIDAVRARGFLV